MKLGIMQPYLFPYLGYYHLMHSVEKLVVYDDVNFIKQGWVNRNRLLLNEQEFLFSVPLKDASSFRPINETGLHPASYDLWRRKFLATLTQAYRKAPFYHATYQLVEQVLSAPVFTIADLARQSLLTTATALGLATRFVQSSTVYNNQHLSGEERVIDICRQERAEVYRNAVGGLALYSGQTFSQHGIQLQFVKPLLMPYPQGKGPFIAGLSIIDVMMFNSITDIKEMLCQYTVVSA